MDHAKDSTTIAESQGTEVATDTVQETGRNWTFAAGSWGTQKENEPGGNGSTVCQLAPVASSSTGFLPAPSDRTSSSNEQLVLGPEHLQEFFRLFGQMTQVCDQMKVLLLEVINANRGPQ